MLTEKGKQKRHEYMRRYTKTEAYRQKRKALRQTKEYKQKAKDIREQADYTLLSQISTKEEVCC
jgi:hypothetical protein